MALRIVWQIRDEKGGFIAGGTQNIDELVTLFGADPTEPCLQAADSMERALLNYLPSRGRSDLVERAERARAQAELPFSVPTITAEDALRQSLNMIAPMERLA